MRCCVEKPRRKKPNQNPIDNDVNDNPTTAKTTTVKVNKIKKKKRKTTTEHSVQKTTPNKVRSIAFLTCILFWNIIS